MKPVIIQNLIRHNKGKYKPMPSSKEDNERHHNAAAKFILWSVAFLVVMGLLLS